MSLQTRLSAFITAVGADIKALNTSVGTTQKVYSPVNRVPGQAEPSDHGYKTWSFDPGWCSSTIIGTAGTLMVSRVFNDIPISITGITIYVATAGGTLSNVGVGIWDASVGGARLASSVNTNGATTSAFQSGSAKVVTFTTPASVTGDFYVGWWTTGTTQPTYTRAGSQNANNVGMPTTLPRFGTANTGLTNTAPATLGTLTQTANGIWVGVTGT